MHMGSSILHFGPAHPAAHGVLRCMLCMRGEYVMGCTLTLGLLHRSTERLMELRHPVTSQTGESYLDCVEGGSVSLSSLLGT